MKTIQDYKKEFPTFALTVTWEHDEYFIWDGDGPDPALSDMYPYNVTVTAYAIMNGSMVSGTAHLGGVYRDNDKDINDDIDGYFEDMADEAIEELQNNLNEIFLA